ncbi:MAG: hypothetical protein F4176_06235, partial [Acidimicrobiia bacterium]|nr:hypothetical protein [Acidimicrobiia bacterium]
MAGTILPDSRPARRVARDSDHHAGHDRVERGGGLRGGPARQRAPATEAGRSERTRRHRERSNGVSAVTEPRTTRSVWGRWWVRVLLALLLLSAVAAIANTPDLLSRVAVSASLRFAVPIVLAGLGGLWAERCGVINIGLEGMMIIGTWMGAWAGFQWSPWVGVLAAVAGGAVFGAFHALMTVSFGVDQAVSGIAINVAALGLGRFLSSIFFEGQPGGGISQSPHVGQIGYVSVPGLAEALDPIASLETPVISD